MGKVNKDSLGNPQPTASVGWNENCSKNPCHKEEQTQCCFTRQKLSHLQTLQAHSCLNSPSLIVVFIQTYFVRLSGRWIKMHQQKEAPLWPQRLHSVYHLTADKSQSASLQLPKYITSVQETRDKASLIAQLALPHFNEGWVMGCTFVPPLTQQHLPLCTLYCKYTTHRDTADLNLLPGSLHMNKSGVILFVMRHNSSAR